MTSDSTGNADPGPSADDGRRGAGSARPVFAATVDVPTPARALHLMVTRGPLRRTRGLTVRLAFSVAALPIYAAAVAPESGGASAAGTSVEGRAAPERCSVRSSPAPFTGNLASGWRGVLRS
ncbi:hypothetical protein GCM10009696_11230 [Kocuria himachalensis]